MNVNPIYLQLAEKYNLNEIKKLERLPQSILVIGSGTLPLRSIGVLLNLPELGRMYAESAYDICIEYDEAVPVPDYEAVQAALGEEPEKPELVCTLQIRCSHPKLKDRRVRLVSLAEHYDRKEWKRMLLEGDVCLFCLSAIHPLAMAERQFIHEYLTGSEADVIYLLNDMDKVAQEEQQRVRGLLERFLPGQTILEPQETGAWDRIAEQLLEMGAECRITEQLSETGTGCSSTEMVSEEESAVSEPIQEKRGRRISAYLREALLVYREQLQNEYPEYAALDPGQIKEAFVKIQQNAEKYCRTFSLENLKTQLTASLVAFHSGLQKRLAEGIEEESNTRALKQAIPGYLFGEWEEFLQGAFAEEAGQGIGQMEQEWNAVLKKEMHKLLPEALEQKIGEGIISGMEQRTENWVMLSYTGSKIGKSGSLSKQELLTEGKKISACCLSDATKGMTAKLDAIKGEMEQSAEEVFERILEKIQSESGSILQERGEKLRELEHDLNKLGTH